ncbi:hypothetical protein [Aestuariivivens sp. NBU2969]|uniref:hypothetical protein n=1 Tax=Aestuariivivens sp. NBU2969 TaxID=2873267 RepID=UPI001CBFB846|nr:hypothetical protein [Aestuariivivens sp. NBU2969]
MKNTLLSMVLVLALVLSFTSCRDTKKSDTMEATIENATEATEGALEEAGKAMDEAAEATENAVEAAEDAVEAVGDAIKKEE